VYDLILGLVRHSGDLEISARKDQCFEEN
jgi:hypothetical protein